MVYAVFAKASFGAHGLEVMPLPNQCSALVRTSAEANALLFVPEDRDEFQAGEKVEIEVVNWQDVAGRSPSENSSAVPTAAEKAQVKDYSPQYANRKPHSNRQRAYFRARLNHTQNRFPRNHPHHVWRRLGLQHGHLIHVFALHAVQDAEHRLIGCGPRMRASGIITAAPTLQPIFTRHVLSACTLIIRPVARR